MSHLVPALVFFMFTPQPHSQPASLPDAPSAQLQPQAPAPSPPAPSTPPPTTPDPHWFRVEQLPPGKAIAVLERSREYPTSCNMDLGDDTTLTCTQASPYSPPLRLVFPVSNIAAVFTEQVEFGPSNKAVIAGLVIGAGVGAGICNQASGGIIATCSLLGATIGWAAATTNPPGPPPARIHRRLIYRAP
ncbi:MAG TPA: hypothetical protein VNY74_02495 [Edaphobacter sp.]|nr:hypothetical protein [Edaphobacter sp.]